MKKLLFILLSFIFGFSLVSCNVKDNSINDSNNTIVQSYSHKFKSGEITDSKTKTDNINGVVWDYTKATHLGFDTVKGVQIGSSNNPQLDTFIISCEFGENVTLVDYSLGLSVGTNGDAIFTICYGTNNTGYSEVIKNTEVKPYTGVQVNVDTNYLKIILQAKQKAIYLESISFSILVNENSKLNLTIDELEGGIEGVKPGENNIPSTNFKPISKVEYYANMNLNLNTDALRHELDSKNDLQKPVSYGDSRYMLQYTDASLTKSGYVLGLYDGLDIEATWQNGQTWNREHVWACNHMTREGDSRPKNSTINHMSDLHNLRACTETVNSARSNKYFSVLKTGADYYDPNTPATNNQDFRGDVARILFYMYVQYDFLLLNDNPDQQANLSMGLLSELIKWHNEDPVDQFEIRRNNRIYEYQGNRNPFIDYPSLVRKLF